MLDSSFGDDAPTEMGKLVLKSASALLRLGKNRFRPLDECHVPIWATRLLRQRSARCDSVRILFE